MTGKNRKSYKADAVYYKKRVDELKEEIKKLQSLKSPSVENNNATTGDANQPTGNNKVVNSEDTSQVAKDLVKSNKSKGQNAPSNSKVNQNPVKLKKVAENGLNEQKSILEIEDEPESEPTTEQEPKAEFKFSCPECSKEFNNLENGCCPFCNEELE